MNQSRNGFWKEGIFQNNNHQSESPNCNSQGMMILSNYLFISCGDLWNMIFFSIKLKRKFRVIYIWLFKWSVCINNLHVCIIAMEYIYNKWIQLFSLQKIYFNKMIFISYYQFSYIIFWQSHIFFTIRDYAK